MNIYIVLNENNFRRKSLFLQRSRKALTGLALSETFTKPITVMGTIPCHNWTNLKRVLSPNPGDDRGLTRDTLIGHGGWMVDQSDVKKVYTHTHTHTHYTHYSRIST